MSDRKSWTKTGHELEEDIEGGEGRWKLSTRRGDWGQEVLILTKGGQNDGRLAADVARLKTNHGAPFPTADPRLQLQRRSDRIHYLSVNLTVTTFPSPAYSGHGLRSSCLRWVSRSRVLFIYRKV